MIGLFLFAVAFVGVRLLGMRFFTMTVVVLRITVSGLSALRVMLVMRSFVQHFGFIPAVLVTGGGERNESKGGQECGEFLHENRSLENGDAAS